MIKDNECYRIMYGKYKGKRFMVVPLVHLNFDKFCLKLIKRAMRHGGRL